MSEGIGSHFQHGLRQDPRGPPTEALRVPRGAPELKPGVGPLQAEEELGRAQKVFEELNVELQDELPILWDR